MIKLSTMSLSGHGLFKTVCWVLGLEGGNPRKMHKAWLLPFSRLQFLGAKALMQKAACDGRKIEGLMEGVRAGLMETVVAFKLCLKHRKGIMASDYGME